LAKTIEYFFYCRLFPFLAVSLHEEPKNTIKISKIRPENLKKSQNKYHGTYLAFFFLRLPLTSSSSAVTAGNKEMLEPPPPQLDHGQQGGRTAIGKRIAAGAGRRAARGGTMGAMQM
jgi:hypothetical protein